jgi:hypothetical protein
MKRETKEEVGKYLELKLSHKGISQQLKNELAQDLSRYIESKVMSECTDIDNKLKTFKGDVQATVEKITCPLHNETQQSNEF